MPDQTTADRLNVILVDCFGVNPGQLMPEAKFVEDLGCDSLDTMELLMQVEEEFDIEIFDEDAERITTVGEAVEYIDKAIAAKS